MRRASGRTSANVGPVAEAREVGLDRHAGAAHRVAALAADGDDREVARVVGDLAGGEADRVRVERAGRAAIRGDEHDQALAALALGQERVVLAARGRRPGRRGPRRASRCTAARASVASWARLSFDAATNCIARVICLMFLTAPMRRRISRWLAMAVVSSGRMAGAVRLARRVADARASRRPRSTRACTGLRAGRRLGAERLGLEPATSVRRGTLAEGVDGLVEGLASSSVRALVSPSSLRMSGRSVSRKR